MVKRKRTGRSAASVGLSLAVGVILAAAGVAVGAWLFTPVTPTTLAGDDAPKTGPVVPREADDSRAVELSVELHPSEILRSSSSGLITAVGFHPGETLTVGQTAYWVGGLPVVALNTETPLWRDLAMDARGDDVVALQVALSDLGYDVAVDGTVGWYTLNAVSRLLGLEGNAALDFAVIQPSSFLWLPSNQVQIETADIAPGMLLNEGDPIASLSPRLEGAKVAEMPSNRVPGARKLLVDGEEFEVDDAGAVWGEEDLSRLQSTASFIAWTQRSGDDLPLRAQYLLKEPTGLYAVPPASIYGIDGEVGCVVSDDTSQPVVIQGSELGQTLVSFQDPGAVPSTVQIGVSGPSCR